MGVVFSRSRVGSDPYYANYEKSFERLEHEAVRLKKLVEKRKQGRVYFRKMYLTVCSLVLIPTIALFAWTNIQPQGTLPWDQHLLRTTPVVVAPVVLYLVYAVFMRWIRYFDSRVDRKFSRLEETKRRMVRELKDSTRFEKTMQLINKYDPDRKPENKASSALARQAPASADGDNAVSGLRRRRMATSMADVRGGDVGSSQLVAAATGAGKMLMPIFDTLANNVIGDDPLLIQKIRDLSETKRRLEAENASLRERVVELEAQLQVRQQNDHVEDLPSLEHSIPNDTDDWGMHEED